MNPVKLPCTFEEKVSKKGTVYQALFVQLTPTYTKTIFLSEAEIELIKSRVSNSEVK